MAVVRTVNGMTMPHNELAEKQKLFAAVARKPHVIMGADPYALPVNEQNKMYKPVWSDPKKVFRKLQRGARLVKPDEGSELYGIRPEEFYDGVIARGGSPAMGGLILMHYDIDDYEARMAAPAVQAYTMLGSGLKEFMNENGGFDEAPKTFIRTIPGDPNQPETMETHEGVQVKAGYEKRMIPNMASAAMAKGKTVQQVRGS